MSVRPVSKQREWQRRMKAEGRCPICGTATEGYLCTHHATIERDRQRNLYRTRRGIPLDAPLYSRKP